MHSDAGRIVTVDGLVAPGELGVTLPHEHAFFDATEAWFTLPDDAEEQSLAEQSVTLENLPWIRRNPFNHRENLRVDSLEEAVAEFRSYAAAGGDAVVDVTPKNVGGRPEDVRTVARRTGLHFVHGTAYYTEGAHPDGLADRDGGDIEAEFVADVRDGIDETGVRAGIVGEVGVSGRIRSSEETVLRAAARAARRTGAPLSIHPPGKTQENRRGGYTTGRWGLEILDIVEEEGLAPSRVAINHLDRSLHVDLDAQRAIAERGAYVEYDLWGRHEFFEAFDDGYPSDVKRLDQVAALIEAGHRSRLLFSHDIAQKTTRERYGGHGYGHLLETIQPMARLWDLPDGTFEAITVDNPRRLLTFDEPEE